MAALSRDPTVSRRLDDGRWLVSRRAFHHLSHREERWIARKLAGFEVACDVGTRAVLLDLDEATKENAKYPYRNRATWQPL